MIQMSATIAGKPTLMIGLTNAEMMRIRNSGPLTFPVEAAVSPGTDVAIFYTDDAETVSLESLAALLGHT